MVMDWLGHIAPLNRETREIDNHYQIASLASSAREITEFHREWLSRLRTGGGASSSTAGTERGFSDLTQEVAGLTQQQAYANAELSDQIGRLVDSLDAGFEGVIGELAHIADEMAAVAGELSLIHSTLRQPRRTKVHELLVEADRALKAGMRSSGRAREAEYADAADLLNKALEDPIGRRESGIWFARGWLAWKHSGDLEGAERAFFDAVRLGEGTSTGMRVAAVRHLAQVRYQRGSSADALEVIRDGIAAHGERPDLLYDGARYASHHSLTSLARQWLRTAIRKWPFLVIPMAVEKDFE